MPDQVASIEQGGQIRVLVCSVTCWSGNTGADSFSALLSKHNPNNVANIYIREQIPDSDRCRCYFQIAESRIIRSVVHRRIQTGVPIIRGETLDNHIGIAKTQQRYAKYQDKRHPFLLMGRELIWKLGKWKTKELDKFICDFSPDVILVEMSGYIHFSTLCRYVIKTCQAPAIGFFWDDNFTYKPYPRTAGNLLYRFFQRRSLFRLSSKCRAFFAISPLTKKECDSTFCIDSVLLTKPIEFTASESEPIDAIRQGTPIRMLYTGALGNGRWDTVKLINELLTTINQGQERLVLDVYSQTDIPASEREQAGPFVRLCGSLSQNDVLEKQTYADILVYLEDIQGEHQLSARLSFSTKLTDYMRAGKCILAVGNPDIAPIRYLAEEDAALCAGTRDLLAVQLKRLSENRDLIREYGEKARRCGKRNHNAKDIRERFYRVINDIVEES